MWRGAEIAVEPARVDQNLAEFDRRLGVGPQVTRRLVLGEAISAALCGGPAAALGHLTDLGTGAAAALTLLPAYALMRRFARREVMDRSLVRGWSAQRAIMARHAARRGPAFSMVSGSLGVRLPVLRVMAQQTKAGPAHSDRLRELAAEPNDFTPGPLDERVRLFFDSIFFTDPNTAEPVWLLVTRRSDSGPATTSSSARGRARARAWRSSARRTKPHLNKIGGFRRGTERPRDARAQGKEYLVGG